MSKNKQKLELTWIGKDERPRLEPRILLEDKTKSYHAAQRISDADIFDNILIKGDNLLALKALEAEYTGKVKCVYIDPPYNTGSAFAHYDDGIEHSLWLSLIRDRLEILRKLLSEDGSIWITLDDNEGHYCKVLCDEIFGRANFVASVAWRSADSSNNDSTQFSIDYNTILVYSKNPEWKSNKLERTESSNAHYSNPDNDPRGAWFSGNVSSPNPRQNLKFDVVSQTGYKIPPPSNGWRWSKEKIDEKIATGEIIFSPDGTRLIRKTYLAEQKGLSPSSLWSDIEDTGHNRQAKYELKKLFPDSPTSELFPTPKPERLIKKILNIATNEGDLVLDSFGGSGTTGAVAHKMRRRWIMVELGEHCTTHIVPRLRKVIDGADTGGITSAVNWTGGGGFRFYELAPSLLKKDKWDNYIINPAYNAEMLAEAMCKHLGFTYAPSDVVYWQHGRSSENDYIYVTTQQMSRETLEKISDEVGTERTLLICCKAFRAGKNEFPNLTLEKIPNQILGRCEWDKDDYSLQIQNLPLQTPEEIWQAAKNAKDAKNGKAENNDLPLFGSE